EPATNSPFTLHSFRRLDGSRCPRGHPSPLKGQTAWCRIRRGLMTSADSRAFLRHTLATLAYRAGKTMRGAPDSFAEYRAAPSARTPVQIVAHMGDLFDWALS